MSPFQLLWKVIQGIILAFRVVIGVIGKAIDRVKDLVGWFKKLPFWGWITSAAKWVGNAVQTTGWAGVPAIAGAPTGGGNIPVANRSAVNQSILHQKPGNAFDLTIHNQVHIDGKQVAESTAKHRQNRIARK